MAWCCIHKRAPNSVSYLCGGDDRVCEVDGPRAAVRPVVRQHRRERTRLHRLGLHHLHLAVSIKGERGGQGERA
jgi:hypothetical protein